MKEMQERYLTMTEAAERMGISYVTLYRAVESGKIRAIRTPGRRRRIPESEVARYWQEQDYNPNGVDDDSDVSNG